MSLMTCRDIRGRGSDLVVFASLILQIDHLTEMYRNGEPSMFFEDLYHYLTVHIAEGSWSMCYHVGITSYSRTWMP